MAILDKFYTKPEVAKKCVNFLKQYVDIDNVICLEPSAGNGSFLPFLTKFEAYDIKPENNLIQQMDFFNFNPAYTSYCTIGNPPFGNRSKLAIDFFNHASKFSNYIAFIVPVSFMKWNVQKELNSNFVLIDYFYLEPNSFMDRDKEFSVRCVFQVWGNKNVGIWEDKRLKKAPPIKHNDFEIWQYNATPAAFNTIEQDWTIATYRQGYHDYNKKFSRSDYDYIKKCMNGEETGKKQQFFFIRPITEEAKNIILNMDFNALAERNTSTPGFGKGDFVSYYEELKTITLKKNND